MNFNDLKYIPKYGMYAAGIEDYTTKYSLYQLASIYGWYVLIGGFVINFIMWCAFLALYVFLKKYLYGED